MSSMESTWYHSYLVHNANVLMAADERCVSAKVFDHCLDKVVEAWLAAGMAERRDRG